MVLAVFGSTSTWFTPRPEPKLEMTAPPGRSGLRQTAVGFPISVKFAPPSVDFQMPIGGKFGLSENEPPVGTATPRTPRPSAPRHRGRPARSRRRSYCVEDD